MALTRNDLETNRLRNLAGTAGTDFTVLSPEALAMSLDSTLANRPDHGDIWVFGYGSLIWNPLLQFAERRVAKIFGYHRRFCIWSRAYRGTPQKPGLVLGLDQGGICRGVAFRIPAPQAKTELELLWRREMMSEAYCPRWLRAETADGPVPAIAFVVNRRNPAYAGRLPLEKMLAIMHTARGPAGTPGEYLRDTIHGLQAHGLRDAQLLDLARKLQDYDAPACNP